jgi:SAM-dependent methyltransferase
MLSEADRRYLVCPDCRAPLSSSARELRCTSCRARWSDVDWPRLYREERVVGNDRLLRYFYDGLPRLHDPAVRFALPVLQTEWVTERILRERFLRHLALDELRRRVSSSRAPVRILEVSIGTGANLPFVTRALPRLGDGDDVEIWGVDLSAGMLAQCTRRLRRNPDPRVRLLMADAHALPFADAFFDRVFHIGAIGNFRDPARALREMARVAKPGTPIVVADEELDRAREHNLFHRAMFRLVTFYDPKPHAPREHVPDGAIDVVTEPLSRFFYCLRFTMPAVRA